MSFEYTLLVKNVSRLQLFVYFRFFIRYDVQNIKYQQVIGKHVWNTYNGKLKNLLDLVYLDALNQPN